MTACGTPAGHRAHYEPGGDQKACEPCKKAHNAYKRELWRRKYLLGKPQLYVDATGIKRRIRALQRKGWRQEDIARAAGYKGTSPTSYVHNIIGQKKVHLKTHAAICGAYDRLCCEWGPSYLTAAAAIRRNWPAPACWDDETIDDPEAKPEGMQDKRTALRIAREHYGISQ